MTDQRSRCRTKIVLQMSIVEQKVIKLPLGCTIVDFLEQNGKTFLGRTK
jgi:hypothetical protein